MSRCAKGLLALCAVLLAALSAGVFLLSQQVPSAVALTDDPVYFRDPVFAVVNPSPVLAMRDVRWSCRIARIGTETAINFLNQQRGGDIAPLRSKRALCVPFSLAGNPPLAVHVTVTFRTFFWNRRVELAPFIWSSADATAPAPAQRNPGGRSVIRLQP
jgi:hypothetical protein